MSVVECDIPLDSVLDRRSIETAYFRDAYCAPVTDPETGIVEIFFNIFGHQPIWIKFALIIRNWIASIFGLEVPTVTDILHPEIKSSYNVGDKIGPWPIFSLSESELVAGRDNKHLDFRLSVLKLRNGGTASVVVSTICVVHNVSGKLYLFFIVPFHKWGLKKIISNAVVAGRL